MTMAVRIPSGRVFVPVTLANGETVDESATVHSARGYVILEEGATEFTIKGPPRRDKTSTFSHFKRVIDMDELPAVIDDEAAMEELREQYANVDDFYRRVMDEKVIATPVSRTLRLSDMRVLDVDTDAAPIEDNTAGWSPDPEFMGLPFPLSTLVPGALTGAPARVAEEISRLQGFRVKVESTYPVSAQKTLVVQFSVGFNKERTKWVKKDPTNSRRNAKRVKVADTRYVELRATVPDVIKAENLSAATAEVIRIALEIIENANEPAMVCSACSGHGLIFADNIREETPRHGCY